MVYSFEDVVATIIGPGGTTILASGAAAADEGISIEMTEDKDAMFSGADGQVVHSLHAAKTAKVTVRLMKTSPVNAVLSVMYNYQITSSSYWGQNVINVSNPMTGDTYPCTSVAFAKFPTITSAKDPGMNEWIFNAGYAHPILGVGIGTV